MELGLRDRACVVTGGSRGIGRATAIALAGEGAGLLLVGRAQEPLAEAAAACEQAGAEVQTLALDITTPGAGDRTVHVCLERFGRIDALVNNAGTSFACPLEELRDRDWQEQ